MAEDHRIEDRTDTFATAKTLIAHLDVEDNGVDRPAIPLARDGPLAGSAILTPLAQRVDEPIMLDTPSLNLINAFNAQPPTNIVQANPVDDNGPATPEQQHLNDNDHNSLNSSTARPCRGDTAGSHHTDAANGADLDDSIRTLVDDEFSDLREDTDDDGDVENQSTLLTDDLDRAEALRIALQQYPRAPRPLSTLPIIICHTRDDPTTPADIFCRSTSPTGPLRMTYTLNQLGAVVDYNTIEAFLVSILGPQLELKAIPLQHYDPSEHYPKILTHKHVVNIARYGQARMSTGVERRQFHCVVKTQDAAGNALPAPVYSVQKPLRPLFAANGRAGVLDEQLVLKWEHCDCTYVLTTYI
jgi:hypothetical protein